MTVCEPDSAGCSSLRNTQTTGDFRARKSFPIQELDGDAERLGQATQRGEQGVVVVTDVLRLDVNLIAATRDFAFPLRESFTPPFAAPPLGRELIARDAEQERAHVAVAPIASTHEHARQECALNQVVHMAPRPLCEEAFDVGCVAQKQCLARIAIPIQPASQHLLVVMRIEARADVAYRSYGCARIGQSFAT